MTSLLNTHSASLSHVYAEGPPAAADVCTDQSHCEPLQLLSPIFSADHVAELKMAAGSSNVGLTYLLMDCCTDGSWLYAVLNDEMRQENKHCYWLATDSVKETETRLAYPEYMEHVVTTGDKHELAMKH